MLFMLQKEVNRLRGLVNGGAENQENDNWSVCFPGSPGSFKWDGGLGSFSPLTSEKRSSKVFIILQNLIWCRFIVTVVDAQLEPGIYLL